MAPSESEIKTRILLAAKKLFAANGFDGTSVRQICEEAGANVALVSYHFGGKEKLFQALFEHYFPTRQMKEYEEILKLPYEGLHLIIKEIIRFGMTDEELSSIIQQELLMHSPRVDVVLTFINPVWKKVRELLESGREQGVFQFESLDHALLFVMGTALSYKMLHGLRPLFTRDEKGMDEMTKQLSALIFAAIHKDRTSA